MSAEDRRLDEARQGLPWRKWGPYLSERQWGTVREDYSSDGAAWESFTHDQARSRAYRWGEDGIAGLSDDRQLLCFALALWNGADPILKERLFGLTNSEGNHGEDVKEYYFYLDNTPTHSWMRMLYKYPQRAFPYADLVETNGSRSRSQIEYELIDTGIFDEDRYFDVTVTYAKADPADILIEITATNRGPDAAPLHLLPTLWFRNTWSWGGGDERPLLQERDGGIEARHPELGLYRLFYERPVVLLFTENETNQERLFGKPNSSPFVKDGIENAVLDGRKEATNAAQRGTKVAAYRRCDIPAGHSATIRLRLTGCEGELNPFGEEFDRIMQQRRAEADAFYAGLLPAGAPAESAMIFRQALAGMLWSKQFYNFDVLVWLREHGVTQPEAGSSGVRNEHWSHMFNCDVISMPDKWEYPWYAAWDLAFHTIPLALVDLDFAKSQLNLMLCEDYLHPNGQMPAYEWAFGDVNPPVHAWGVLFVHELERQRKGAGDHHFLRQSFHKLLQNFTWWLNRKDPAGHGVFEGGFLGLDNIGVFDRSAPLPTGGRLEQADGTAWVALFGQAMLQMAVELSETDPDYYDLALQFVRHFCRTSFALNGAGAQNNGMWDEEDGFYYDLLRLPNGSRQRLKTRSLVGLLPLCATVILEPDLLAQHPEFMQRVERFLRRHAHLATTMAPIDRVGVGGRRMLAVVDEARLRRILVRLLDPEEFLGDYGIRSVSRWHLEHPYVFSVDGTEYRFSYEPADSASSLFGGNSNWRGPIWFPINGLIIRALRQFYLFYGDEFTVECPTGSGIRMTLYEVAQEISRRLISIFRLNSSGRRPVFGETAKFQTDQHWRDPLLFYEYFHGDSGAGVGASHQTGWTGLVATLIMLDLGEDAVQFLSHGRAAAIDTLAGRRAAAPSIGE